MRNVSKGEVLELIKEFPYQPRFNKVIITLNSVEEEGKVQVSNSLLDETQYVLAVGPMVNDIKPGDKVLIDIEKLMVPTRQDNGDSVDTVMQVEVTPVEIGEHIFTFVEDRIINAIDKQKK